MISLFVLAIGALPTATGYAPSSLTLAPLGATPSVAAPSQAGERTPANARAFLQQTLSNGVTRVHVMRSSDTIVQPARAIASVQIVGCLLDINYVGEWFGLAEEFALNINLSKAVEVKPFYDDSSRSAVALLVPVVHFTRVQENLPGIVLEVGSESMEPRVTAALQILIADCNPEPSLGF